MKSVRRTRPDLQAVAQFYLGSFYEAGEITERNLDLASRNNPRLRVRRVMGLNVVDLLDYEVLVVSEAAIRRLEEVLA